MLPINTSPEDVVSIVDYLKAKATGATPDEVRATIGGTALDGRKLSGYRAWDFVIKDGDKLRLTERGRRFARASAEQRQVIFGEVIRSIRAYRLAVEWMFHQNFETLTAVDLAAHWHEHVSSDLGTDKDRNIQLMVNCFFQLAEGAGLGNFIIGRRDQPTRFDINRDALGQFIAETSFQVELPPTELGDHEEKTALQKQVASDVGSLPPTAVPKEHEEERALEPVKAFISHGKNAEIVDQVKTMLELADLHYEIAVEEETTAIPVSDKVLNAMHRCNAAVICVTADADMQKADGTFGVNQNVLIEIGSAFVLYEKRVVLVWDRRIAVPSNLQGLYRCEFEGNELSWSAGMKLMKAVNQFKKA